MLTVVTGFSEAGWIAYGERMVRTFDKWWPLGVDLCFFHDGARETTGGSSRRRIRGLPYRAVADWVAFQDDHRGSARAGGRAPTRAWRAKEIAAGYSYRTDARKFARVPLAVRWFCHEVAASDHVIWLDGDTVFYRPVPKPAALLPALFPGGAEVSLLGRHGNHSEIGYVGYRLPAARALLDVGAAIYSTGEFMAMDETHSAHAFDLARERVGDGVRCHDLTPGGTGHVWMQSPLVAFSDHLKGDRKARGFSHEHPDRGEVKRA